MPRRKPHSPNRGRSAAGYRVLARMRAAGALAQVKPAEAVKAYDEISADSSVGQVWQDLAAVRAGMLLVDTLSLADMRRRLDAADGTSRSFRHSARELLALSAWRNHDLAAARRYLDMIASDAEIARRHARRVRKFCRH